MLIHALAQLTNCLECGKIVYEHEASDRCDFCGARLLASIGKKRLEKARAASTRSAQRALTLRLLCLPSPQAKQSASDALAAELAHEDQRIAHFDKSISKTAKVRAWSAGTHSTLTFALHCSPALSGQGPAQRGV